MGVQQAVAHRWVSGRHKAVSNPMNNRLLFACCSRNRQATVIARVIGNSLGKAVVLFCTFDKGNYMQKTKAGFTLVELLVVVLIIGILAAVAVPQYQLAVTKARFMELITIGNALHNANEVYYMENNAYATNRSLLDIQMEIPSYMSISLGSAKDSYVAVHRGGMSYIYYADFHGDNAQYNGRKECRADATDILGQKACRQITGQEGQIHSGTYTYWSSVF